MIQLNIKDEISQLKSVVLGIAESSGKIPSPKEAYDPKSLEHILAGTYPQETNMIREMSAFARIFHKYGVTLYRPDILDSCNQIFSRDIAFVIEDRIFLSNILPDRDKEIKAIHHVLDNVKPEQIVMPPAEVHVEGGDGTYTAQDYPDFITARTNIHAVEFLKTQFPNKTVQPFELRKSNTDARHSALHLDCCFQPLGKGKAILCKHGFLIESEYQWLVDFFGADNIFEITNLEMYEMYSNVFSISPEVVVTEQSFTRLNNWLRDQGFTVEEIPYAEISKQGGLLRCSTLPLERA